MDGILVVDKPQGLTSHDVVDFMRRRFKLKKAGHAGTLDPMATGVLVMLVGSLTKSSDSLMSDDKEYEATLVLGATSDTGDAWGKITSSPETINLTREKIEEAFKKFIGDIEQLPPMHSAVKFKGRKLYQFARKGIDVPRHPRKVSIKRLEILDIKFPSVSFKVVCSKGTYIRQLSADIGEALSCGAYLTSLRRTRSGRFSIDGALAMDELEKMGEEDLKKRLLCA